MEDQYLMYLRKSRKDLEAEQQGDGETLARHRKILTEFAEKNGYAVAQVYEEIVSGDSIAARPEMQKMLSAVETGMYAGVIVMEVERLCRGDGIDQAIISRTFQFTNTKIVTPLKTYDPSNEVDAEFLGLGLFMARHEYNTIKRRLLAGKKAAAQEGKWANGSSPFGYDKQKLTKQKGYTLVPNKDADTVRLIFSLFIEGLTLAEVAHKLNSLKIPTPSGTTVWSSGSVSRIITNPVYVGKIRCNFRKKEKRIVNGEVVISSRRSSASEINIIDGKHEPIISVKDWESAQQKYNVKYLPLAGKKECRNPFAHILKCGNCGHFIRFIFHKGQSDGYAYCGHCDTFVSSKLSEVEDAVLAGLRMWIPE